MWCKILALIWRINQVSLARTNACYSVAGAREKFNSLIVQGEVAMREEHLLSNAEYDKPVESLDVGA